MKNRFNWSNFELEFLNSVLNSPKTPQASRPTFTAEESFELAPFMDSITPYPTRQFVLDYRGEIESQLFERNPQLVVSVFGTRTYYNSNSLLRELKNKKLGELLANRYIVALYRIGLNAPDWDMSEYTRPVVLDLQKSAPINPALFDFQTEAVNKLNAFAQGSDHKSGFVVIPTGGGKTRVAVTFLLRDLVSQGYQVIWLVHRHLLIDQAADQFKIMCPLILDKDPGRKVFKMICSSGKHGTIKAASKKQDVMILSVQTAVRNLDFLKNNLQQKVIIVVDEAHHTSAPSYRRIVDAIRKKRPDTLLLGLTATPIRYTDSSTQDLYRMFEGNFIYEIGMSKLIKQGVLAQPQFTHVATGIDFEPQITVDEGKYIDRYGELPSSLVNKIALSKQRNNIILQQYFQRPYGKTLIFALNIVHAQMLTDDLKKRHVNCGCVFSGQENNDEVIREFSDGRLDVLVNINILTEGSDVPGIETVFLTRPTQSEGLLMQMIGRGMRGTLAGGTEHVEIVDFVDQWDVFARWLDPEFALPDGPEGPTETGEVNRQELVQIPWSIIRAIYRDMGAVGGHILESQTIPVGWYALDDEGEPFTLLVFENQLSGYKEMLRSQKYLAPGQDLSPGQILTRFFSAMGAKPTAHSIQVFWNHLRNAGSIPHLFLFKDRRDIDAYCMAQRLRDSSENLFQVADAVYRDHEEMISELYGSLEEYREHIFKILNYNATPDTAKIEEMPLELVPFKMDKPHDLQALYAEVQEEMRDPLGECAQDTGSILWTDKPFKSLFGRYFGQSGNIEINCILNSTAVPREAVKYLLYHEMLHRRYWYHDKVFRTMEHKYPNYTELEKFLDSDFGNFRFDY